MGVTGAPPLDSLPAAGPIGDIPPPEGPPPGEGPPPDHPAIEGAENIVHNDDPPPPPPPAPEDPPPPPPPGEGEPHVELAGAVTHPEDSPDGPGGEAVKVAREQIGTPYVWGGKAPGGFDCSGLVSYALEKAGLIDGYMTSQALAKAGTPVDEQDVRPGDVVVYGSDNHHVAIVSSINPTKIIQAQQTGTDIAEGDVSDGGKDFKFVRFGPKGGDGPPPDTVSI